MSLRNYLITGGIVAGLTSGCENLPPAFNQAIGTCERKVDGGNFSDLPRELKDFSVRIQRIRNEQCLMGTGDLLVNDHLDELKNFFRQKLGLNLKIELIDVCDSELKNRQFSTAEAADYVRKKSKRGVLNVFMGMNLIESDGLSLETDQVSAIAVDSVVRFSTILHEVGHSFGLDHVDDPKNVMSAGVFEISQELKPGQLAMMRCMTEQWHGDELSPYTNEDNLELPGKEEIDFTVKLASLEEVLELIREAISDTTNVHMLLAPGTYGAYDFLSSRFIHSHDVQIVIEAESPGTSILVSDDLLIFERSDEDGELGLTIDGVGFANSPFFDPEIPSYPDAGKVIFTGIGVTLEGVNFSSHGLILEGSEVTGKGVNTNEYFEIQLDADSAFNCTDCDFGYGTKAVFEGKRVLIEGKGDLECDGEKEVCIFDKGL